jgi:hypothetical protein
MGAEFFLMPSMLFDAIAADVKAGNDQRPAYMAASTVTMIQQRTIESARPGVAKMVIGDPSARDSRRKSRARTFCVPL